MKFNKTRVEEGMNEYNHTHAPPSKGSHVGAYDCGCEDTDPVIEQWTGYIGFRVGASVCRNCGRVISLQIQSSGGMNHEILELEE